MANNNIPINVNVNFNGVTYSGGAWSGTPAWNINPSPAPVNPVKSGDTNTIQWNLHAAAVPNPFTASFTGNAIQFSGTPAWTGGAPITNSTISVSVTDTFNGLQSAVNYYYSITVTLSGVVNGNNVTQTFRLDPDVQNEAGSMNAAMRHA